MCGVRLLSIASAHTTMAGPVESPPTLVSQFARIRSTIHKALGGSRLTITFIGIGTVYKQVPLASARLPPGSSAAFRPPSLQFGGWCWSWAALLFAREVSPREYCAGSRELLGRRFCCGRHCLEAVRLPCVGLSRI